MSALSPFCLLECPCSEALQQTQVHLSQAGLRVVQTFDLHTARHSPRMIPQPVPGKDASDWQMVIFLIYGEAMEPVTLILQGDGYQTLISFAENASHPADDQIRSRIEEIIQDFSQK